MKKFLLLIGLPLFLTGCFFGEVGSGYTTKICTKETNYNNILLTEVREVKQKDNNIISINFRNTIKNNGDDDTFNSLKNSYAFEKINLEKVGCTTSVVTNTDNEYSVEYLFSYDKVSDDIKGKYGFEDLFHNQIKKYESENYKCK